MNVDERCLIAAIGGDREAAAELIESIWPDAYRIAWSNLRDASAAEDAAQEACARAWRALASVRDSKRFAVWFYRIVVNECRRRNGHAPYDVPLADSAAALDDKRDDERIDVRRAIDALPASLRLAVVLRYYYDLTSVEIATVVGTSPVTVRWRLMLAHRRLRNLLDVPQGEYRDETIVFG